MELQAPHPLDEHHSTTGFDCGDDSFSLWLHHQALGNQRSGVTRTFVVCHADGAVKAYVALASGAVAVAASPGRFRRNMPDPIPVVVLALLAVCRSVQGLGIACALLADTFERVLMASEQIGVRGVVVHVASAAARDFYLHMGFDPSSSDPNTLLLRLVDIAAACRQHQVRRMHLFGSALRDDFDPSRSDLDLLVEFQPIEPGALVQADAVGNPYVLRDIEASKTSRRPNS